MQTVVTVTLDVPRAITRSGLDVFLQKLLWESDSVNANGPPLSIIRLKVKIRYWFHARHALAYTIFRKQLYVLCASSDLHKLQFSTSLLTYWSICNIIACNLQLISIHFLFNINLIIGGIVFMGICPYSFIYFMR